MFLRQSTSQVFRIGPFVDSTDGVTPETGLTIANTDCDLSKDGAAFGSKNSGGLTADGSNGWYSGTLDTTDTNTVGELIIEVTVSGALPVWTRYYVVEEAIYDKLFAGSAALNDIAATAIVSGGAITTSGGAVSNVTTVATTTTNTDMRGTNSAMLASSAPANFGDLAITASTGLVTVGTNNDKTGYSISGTKNTLDDLNDIAATDIVTGGAITTSAGAVSNVILVATTTTNTDMRGTDGANTGTPPTAAAIRAEIDSNSTQLTLIAGHTGEIGTAGAGLTNINLPNQTMDITGNLSGSVGSVTAEVNANITKINSVTVTGAGTTGNEWRA